MRHCRLCAAVTAALSFFTLVSCAEYQPLPRRTRLLLDTYDWRFEEFRPGPLPDESQASHHVRYYLTEASVETVWNAYMETPPERQWRGPIVQLAGVYDPQSQVFATSSGTEIPNYSVGQVFFLDLILEGFKHLPTTFVVSEISRDQHRLVFQYTEINPCHGQQEIEFIAIEGDDDYNCLIRHRTLFQSASELRDIIYPAYHESAVDEFHIHLARDNGYRVKPVSLRTLEKKGLVP